MVARSSRTTACRGGGLFLADSFGRITRGLLAIRGQQATSRAVTGGGRLNGVCRLAKRGGCRRSSSGRGLSPAHGANGSSGPAVRRVMAAIRLTARFLLYGGHCAIYLKGRRRLLVRQRRRSHCRYRIICRAAGGRVSRSDAAATVRYTGGCSRFIG